ncbi:MAG: glucose-6-phosphate isomerase [Alphaproteobacteria bacterium]
MSYVQLTSTCFSEAIGAHGLDRARYDQLIEAAGGALDALRGWHQDASLPLLRLPETTDDLPELAALAEDYRQRFDDVVLLGTGGSSLGGQTLCALADRGFGPLPGAPRLRFMDNIDPDSFKAMLAALSPLRTGFLVVSKSGATAETLTQFLVCLDAFRAALGDAASEHFTIITEPGDNPLRRLAGRFGMRVLDHDPGLGGRFSALSLVGLLPAMIAGLDGAAVRRGAASVLRPILDDAPAESLAPVVGAAIAVGLARDAGVAISVVMPYIDRLADFSLWHRQLWAESLGKQGQGTTPVNALGAVDQHSQLQLYLDGPRDKMFSLIMLACDGVGPVVPKDLADDPELDYLRGRTIGALMDAEQRATAKTLVRSGQPTRIFRLASLDEEVMGALMMHFMLETIIAAHLLGVDPFDQPAVEEGKVLTREYLAAES